MALFPVAIRLPLPNTIAAISLERRVYTYICAALSLEQIKAGASTNPPEEFHGASFTLATKCLDREPDMYLLGVLNTTAHPRQQVFQLGDREMV